MYQILKAVAKIALWFYTYKTKVVFHDSTSYSGPKIIASNHPNSFFDAIVIAVTYKKPIYFLARGDAFKKPLVTKILKSLHLIPIYRLSEGVNNMSKNQETFNQCLRLLQQNETILIFSEGICINEWKLRTIKKGTARICWLAYQNGITNLTLQPTALNYSSFTKVPKDIRLFYNEEIPVSSLDNSSETQFYKECNASLKTTMKVNLIEQYNKNEVALFTKEKNKKIQYLLAIPAVVGYLSQKWLYTSIQKKVRAKTEKTVFYDSILFGTLLFVYPLFVVILSLLIGSFTNYCIGLFVFILLPSTALAYKKYKEVI